MYRLELPKDYCREKKIIKMAYGKNLVCTVFENQLYVSIKHYHLKKYFSLEESNFKENDLIQVFENGKIKVFIPLKKLTLREIYKK